MNRFKNALIHMSLKWFGTPDPRVVLEIIAMLILCFIAAIGAWLALWGVIKS